MHASSIELRILKHSSYVLACFAEGYFGDSKKSLSEVIQSMEFPEASGSPLARFLEEARAVQAGICAGDEARRAAVQRFCKVNNEMWQIIKARSPVVLANKATESAVNSRPRQWLAAATRGFGKPHILVSFIWIFAAIAFAYYEVHEVPYKAAGWLIYFPGYGSGYPRPIGWLFVASVLSIIWFSLSGKLSGAESFLPRLAVAVASIAVTAIFIWAAYTPKTSADCLLTHIKAGMSDDAVQEVTSACFEKYP